MSEFREIRHMLSMADVSAAWKRETHLRDGRISQFTQAVVLGEGSLLVWQRINPINEPDPLLVPEMIEVYEEDRLKFTEYSKSPFLNGVLRFFEGSRAAAKKPPITAAQFKLVVPDKKVEPDKVQDVDNPLGFTYENNYREGKALQDWAGTDEIVSFNQGETVLSYSGLLTRSDFRRYYFAGRWHTTLVPGTFQGFQPERAMLTKPGIEMNYGEFVQDENGDLMIDFVDYTRNKEDVLVWGWVPFENILGIPGQFGSIRTLLADRVFIAGQLTTIDHFRKSEPFGKGVHLMYRIPDLKPEHYSTLPEYLRITGNI